MLTATDKKPQNHKQNITWHHIDIQAMCWWETCHFYDFCSFVSVNVKIIYKTAVFHIYFEYRS